MEKAITYVGLDVHKETIAVALAEIGRRDAVREHGKIANTPTALKGLAAKMRPVILPQKSWNSAMFNLFLGPAKQRLAASRGRASAGVGRGKQASRKTRKRNEIDRPIGEFRLRFAAEACLGKRRGNAPSAPSKPRLRRYESFLPF